MSDFPSTRWSLILTAGVKGPGRRAALASLCQIYWPAVYAFARYRGYPPEQAEDLTQGFFMKLLEKNYVEQADPIRGKFRTFLLTSFRNYMANEWDRSQAQKRGSGQPPLSLDFPEAEGALRHEPVEFMTPEKLFARRWARTLLNRALLQLKGEMVAAGKLERFERFKGFLTDYEKENSYSKLAAEFGMTESAVKVAIHRMRQRFGKLVRSEIADTVGDDSEISEEIRFLIDALGP